jgi:hypothetical protein
MNYACPMTIMMSNQKMMIRFVLFKFTDEAINALSA